MPFRKIQVFSKNFYEPATVFSTSPFKINDLGAKFFFKKKPDPYRIRLTKWIEMHLVFNYPLLCPLTLAQGFYHVNTP